VASISLQGPNDKHKASFWQKRVTNLSRLEHEQSLSTYGFSSAFLNPQKSHTDSDTTFVASPLGILKKKSTMASAVGDTEVASLIESRLFIDKGDPNTYLRHR